MFISEQYAVIWNLDGNYWDALLDTAADMYQLVRHPDSEAYCDIDLMLLSI